MCARACVYKGGVVLVGTLAHTNLFDTHDGTVLLRRHDLARHHHDFGDFGATLGRLRHVHVHLVACEAWKMMDSEKDKKHRRGYASEHI